MQIWLADQNANIPSLNDQVVPVCSELHTAASHPPILRALYIDGDAYQYLLYTPIQYCWSTCSFFRLLSNSARLTLSLSQFRNFRTLYWLLISLRWQQDLWLCWSLSGVRAPRFVRWRTTWESARVSMPHSLVASISYPPYIHCSISYYNLGLKDFLINILHFSAFHDVKNCC